ncbi:MAG: hypothetical protein ETSY1_26705 [Candidatus Entotheonella factor]|uniref:Cytochrome P450 n=1 Tax=Entotheonella factor TaxID=1429438 RepID=W4LEA8_ENTF1|nr:MAG: hypothetical protein ETSY1_26705 [Candidatus Entotheonella factor]
MKTDLFHNPQRFGDMQTWRQDVLALHRAGPIHRIEPEGFRPFWAVIGHPELLEVERDPKRYTNGPVPVLASDIALKTRTEQGGEIRTLIHMDAPDHLKYRRLTNDWFRPSSIRQMQPRIDELSQQAVTKFEQAGGELDFNIDIAIPYPLHIILSVMGLPEEDYPRMLQLTQQLFGASDPDLQREGTSPEETAAIIHDFNRYFSELTAQRRQCPSDDLASFIANGQIDGQTMPDLETLGYYIIIATAGHDTTAAAMSQGIECLAQNPDQLRQLQQQPELIPDAVEEIIRISSPVKHFMRKAQEDGEIGGQQIAQGDWLMISFAAANLDPRVFKNPLAFDFTRENLSRHVAFGSGVHFCLGAPLARMELCSLFSHLIPRLASLELAGEPTTSKSTFVSGHKSLPVRYQLT